ncbi:MAG TPA: endonuclease/exonuclease/phosphatase family protein [Polyangiaceae bacterium]|nr:endonuclease/exonuclease/phosphatase family protein [Polyangiaceae bacterium]
MRRGPRTRLLAIVLAAFAFVSVAPTPARATELRVVTFNVAMGLLFRKPFAGLIRSTFANNEYLKHFDVIGLQEACQNDRAAIELFRGVMLRTHGRVYEHLVLADAQTTDSCRKAQVILSRYPIVHAGGMQLPRIGAWRSAAWVDLKVGADTVRVYNLHLSNRNGSDYTPLQGRWRQGKIVLEHWLDAKQKDPRLRGIVLGDFNSMGDLWRPSRRELTIAKYSQSMTPNLRRYVPTMFVPYQSDWIFSSGLKLRRSYVVPTMYSDHFVVMADYSF